MKEESKQDLSMKNGSPYERDQKLEVINEDQESKIQRYSLNKINSLQFKDGLNITIYDKK